MLETIGQRLKKAREARYLSLEKASAETRIRVVFLQALEADDFSAMPSAAQGRGFLRNYAGYLGLDIDEIIAEMQRNAPEPAEVSGPLPQVNLVETDLPPLSGPADEPPAPRFWTRWFARRARTESTPQPTQEKPVESAAPPAHAADVETMDLPEPHGRRKRKIEFEVEPPQPAAVTEVKASGEIPPVEEEQAEVREEAKPGLFAGLASIFQFNIKKQEAESIPEAEGEIEEKEEIPPQPSLPADMIFAEVGAQLRQRRELISLTVEEVERHTKLRAVFVKALEEGAFEKLPSPVQTRGMLLNYATFLDLDVDAILLRFADALQARRHEKYAETPREKIQTQVTPSMPFLRTYLAGDLLFGLVMIVVLVALAVWGVERIVNVQEQPDEPEVPVVADVLENLPSETPSPEFGFDPSLPTATLELDAFPSLEAPTPLTNANVTVSVFALERVFVRISVDGKVAFEGRMAPREVKVFEADDQVVVLTGNGAALRITYNGRDLGLMGGVGEVVSRVYLESGVATPTATVPPTPTNTPLVTPTSTPTITPTATPLEN